MLLTYCTGLNEVVSVLPTNAKTDTHLAIWGDKTSPFKLKIVQTNMLRFFKDGRILRSSKVAYVISTMGTIIGNGTECF